MLNSSLCSTISYSQSHTNSQIPNPGWPGMPASLEGHLTGLAARQDGFAGQAGKAAYQIPNSKSHRLDTLYLCQ